MPYKKYPQRNRKPLTPYQQGLRGGTAHRGRYSRTPFQQLQRDIGYLRGLINVEFKIKDYHLPIASPGVLSSGTIQLLNGLAQGDGSTNRDGNQVRFKSLESKTLVSRNGLDAVFRMIYFIDLQTDGAAPTMADVLDTASASGIVAPRNLTHRNRFLILKDVTKVVNTDTPNAVISYFRKLDLKSVYTSTGSAIGNMKNHPVFVLYVSDVPATNGPVVESHHRMRFIDN